MLVHKRLNEFSNGKHLLQVMHVTRFSANDAACRFADICSRLS